MYNFITQTMTLPFTAEPPFLVKWQRPFVSWCVLSLWLDCYYAGDAAMPCLMSDPTKRHSTRLQLEERNPTQQVLASIVGRNLRGSQVRMPGPKNTLRVFGTSLDMMSASFSWGQPARELLQCVPKNEYDLTSSQSLQPSSWPP